jgi:predicted nicotinamide N-methyase
MITQGERERYDEPPGSSHGSMNMVSPNQEEPQLLLEGDEFHVSHDGIARSFYSLAAGSSSSTGSSPPLALEEFYDLQGAHKTFVVRVQEPFDTPISDDGDGGSRNVEVLSKQAQGLAPLGRPIATIGIQEIDHGVFDSAGTGSTTWEASIAMALYFSSHPDQLFGDAVEVGCGIGLGGILNTVGSSMWIHERDDSSSEMKSVTLTDGNSEVLQQCKQNIQSVLSSLPAAVNSLPPIQVAELDWDEFVNPKMDGNHKTYHTVIACDCAYLHTEIQALSRTVKGLLREDASAKIHLFGPYNRSALHAVIKYLQEQLDLDVCVEWVEMDRYRLKPGSREKNPDLGQYTSTSMDECAYASKSIVKFLHVTASHKTNKSHKHDDESLADIDL